MKCSSVCCIVLLFIGVALAQNTPEYEPCQPFLSFETIRDCDNPVEEQVGVTDDRTCESTCASDNTCFGYIFEFDLLRCSFNRRCRQVDAVTRGIKKCGNNQDTDKKDDIRRIDISSPWDLNKPDATCVRKCPDIPRVKFALHQARNNMVGSQVIYHCKVGELVGSQMITCNMHGQWEPEPPMCNVTMSLMG